MGLSINTNIASLNAQRNLSNSQSALSVSLERLSSGLRINSAKDDAAGLAISERFTTQIRGLNQAARNANDGISLAQTAEGALSEVTNNLQRIRELAIQSANATNSASDRAALNNEAQQLISEIDRVATQTTFNGRALFDGSFTAQAFQVGANANETISVSMSSARTSSLGAFATVTSAENDATGRGISNVTFATGGAAGDSAQLEVSEMTVNGTAVAAPTADGVSSDLSSQSAIAIANAINSSVTGVTASAEANTVNLGAVTAGSLISTGLSINGVDIGAVSVLGGDTDAALQTAINNVQNQTGVTASLNSSNQFILTAADGRNIQLTQAAGGAASVTAQNIFAAASNATTADVTGAVDIVFDATDNEASSFTIRGQVSITSSSSITLADGASGAVAEIGFTAGSQSVATSTALSNVLLSTAANSTSALQTLDTALDVISSQRATLGAVQNRFESTIASLTSTSENLSAARGRIQDADFAAETAALTRNQILQQAGVSILSQANSLPQLALSLLQ